MAIIKTDTTPEVKIRTGRNKLASLVAGVAVSAVSLLGASLARATTTITRQTGTRITGWTGVFSSSPTYPSSVGLEDASLSNTALGNTRDDAFDGALEIYLMTPNALSSSDSSTSVAVDIDLPSITVTDNSPNGGMVSGTSSATLNGTAIGVDWSLVFASDAAEVTGTFVVTNNSSTPFDGIVAVYTDFGSDDVTVVEATSSGDTTLADGDTWVVSSEESGESSGYDPIILSVINNPNAVIGPYTDMNSGDENLVWRVPVSLAPGASETVTAGHCLYETIAEAQAAGVAGACVTPPAPPTPPVIAAAAAAAAPPTPVPVMQNPALLALAVLTGLLGTGSLVSRKKKLK
ncbi:MAG: hypothetical protein V7746_24770 [Halioglobus sp.]